MTEFRPSAPSTPEVVVPQSAMPGYAPAAPLPIEWPSDLQQVESDPDKVRAAQEQVAPAAAPVSRPRRERVPRPVVADEPLVQVETGPADAPATSGEKTPA